MHSGTTLFLSAVMAVLRNPLTALKVAWLPYGVSLAVYIWAEQIADPENIAVLASTVIVDTLMLPLVAVGWHRFRLIEEQPGITGVRTEPSRLLQYALEWLVLGVLVGLGIVAVAAALLLGLYFFGLEAALDQVLIALDAGEFDPLLALLIFAVIWVFTWGFFRIALSLPDMAIRHRDTPRPHSWALTGAIEPGVFVASGYAAVATTLLLAPTYFIYDLFSYEFLFMQPLPEPESYDYYRFSTAYLALSQFCWSVITLFGASILTEIYRAANHADGPVGHRAPNNQTSGE